MAFFLVPLLDPRINQRSSLVVLYGAFSHHHPPQLRYLNQRLQTHGPGAELDPQVCVCFDWLKDDDPKTDPVLKISCKYC